MPALHPDLYPLNPESYPRNPKLPEASKKKHNRAGKPSYTLQRALTTQKEPRSHGASMAKSAAAPKTSQNFDPKLCEGRIALLEPGLGLGLGVRVWGLGFRV